jgi:membrane peptidoglycan carboxypeptidase
LVKNLFLTRSKTLSRKLQEGFLSLYLETELPKERILELYLNCIEFGRGIYGIEPAARQYFDKHCWDLLPEEVAFLMMCKPSPRDCQRLFDRQRGVRGVWREKVDFVLGRLHKLAGVIDESEHEAALARPIHFAAPN